jgi:hypothetical protein
VATAGRWLLGSVLALAAGALVLYVALPANEQADEGPADPILHIRRPVVRALKFLKILKFDERFVNPYLPTGREEPVYRGIFWPVGWRMTRRVTDHNGLGMRSARLCYAVGSERFVAAEDESPRGPSVELTGFIPLSARGYWTEMTSEDGRVLSVNGSGDIDPFWRD